MKKNPLLSIIIPTYNEEKDISQAIKSLQKQSYKKFEIIIVDDGSTDETTRVVSEFEGVRVLRQNHKGPGAARNLGARNANGEILILVDADMTFDKDYLKNLIKPIIEKNVLGTEEQIQNSTNDKNIWSRCWGKLRTNPNNKKGKIFRAIKKDEFLRLGGFDSKHGYADDQTFLFKYNLKSDIAEGAICYHNNPETLAEVYNQSKWLGASMEKKFLNVHIIKHILPFILVLFSPIGIIFWSLRKCHKNKKWSLLLPWMLIFMTVRYFGTIHGIFNRAYLKRNVR